MYSKYNVFNNLRKNANKKPLIKIEKECMLIWNVFLCMAQFVSFLDLIFDI